MEDWDQGTGRLSVWQEISFWFIDGHLLTMLLHSRRSVR